MENTTTKSHSCNSRRTQQNLHAGSEEELIPFPEYANAGIFDIRGGLCKDEWNADRYCQFAYRAMLDMSKLRASMLRTTKVMAT